jgi:hypothetical protein
MVTTSIPTGRIHSTTDTVLADSQVIIVLDILSITTTTTATTTHSTIRSTSHTIPITLMGTIVTTTIIILITVHGTPHITITGPDLLPDWQRLAGRPTVPDRTTT